MTELCLLNNESIGSENLSSAIRMKRNAFMPEMGADPDALSEKIFFPKKSLSPPEAMSPGLHHRRKHTGACSTGIMCLPQVRNTGFRR